MLKLQFFFIVLLISIKISKSTGLQIKNSLFTQSSSSALSESRAIADVIREFYIANHIQFDFIVYGETSNHINDVIDGVIKQADQYTIPVTLKHIKYVKNWNHEMDQSAVIFVKSQKILQDLHNSAINNKNFFPLLTNMETKQFKFLIYVDEIKSLQQLNDAVNETNVYLSFEKTDLRYFEFFVTSDELWLNLTARLIYSEDHCGEFKLKVLNSVDKRSQQWTKRLENFDQFRNFHGCLMPFIAMNSPNFYVKNYAKEDDELILKNLTISGRAEFGGLTNEVMKLLAENNNFSLHLSLFTFNSTMYKWIGSKSYNVSVHQLVSPLEISVTDRIIFLYHFSKPFATVDWYFIVSQNDLYTNYEKLLFPFDVATWSLLLFTLGLTFGSIFGLRFSPQWIKTMVIGRGKSS
jgi:hypothetical protein